MKPYLNTSSGPKICQHAANKLGNTCQRHYSMRWFSTAYQKAMSISWCRKVPTGSFVDLRTRFTNNQESCQHREKANDEDDNIQESQTQTQSSGKFNALPKSNLGQTCNCCDVKGHLKTDCYHKDEAES